MIGRRRDGVMGELRKTGKLGHQDIRRPGDQVQELILYLTDNVRNGNKPFLRVSVDQFL
jgi:hypothetical protein